MKSSSPPHGLPVTYPLLPENALPLHRLSRKITFGRSMNQVEYLNQLPQMHGVFENIQAHSRKQLIDCCPNFDSFDG